MTAKTQYQVLYHCNEVFMGVTHDACEHLETKLTGDIWPWLVDDWYHNCSFFKLNWVKLPQIMQNQPNEGFTAAHDLWLNIQSKWYSSMELYVYNLNLPVMTVNWENEISMRAR